jgi:hypothetical protein
MSAMSETEHASATLSVPHISARASALSAAAQPHERHELFIGALRIWALTLVILALPALAAVMLRADPTGQLQLTSSEIRRSQVLTAHSARLVEVKEVRR